MTKEFTVDLAVVGFGKSGKMLAASQAKAGKKVVLIEQSAQMYGGTCINVGCVPTKILVHDAQTGFGKNPDASLYAAAQARREKLTGAMRAKNLSMQEAAGVEVLTGTASFLSADSLQVTAADGTTSSVRAAKIVINTGARPSIPNLPGVTDTVGIFDTEGLLQLPERPAALVIVGGGPIGLEFAGMFAGFGTQVTVLEHAERLLPREDEDVAASVAAALEAQGIKVQTGVQVTGFSQSETGVIVHTASGDVSGTAVLLATGRHPNTEGLNLAAAGIETGARGEIVVDEFCRTSNPNVYATGDVNGGPQFTYISLDDYRIVLDQLNPPADRQPRSTKDRQAVPTNIFTTPHLARVGLTEAAALAKAEQEGWQVKVFTKAAADLAATPRVKIEGAPGAAQDPRALGMVKIVVDAKSNQILGAALHIVNGAELINLLALAIRAQLPYTMLRDGIWTHPSVTELLNEVLS